MKQVYHAIILLIFVDRRSDANGLAQISKPQCVKWTDLLKNACDNSEICGDFDLKSVEKAVKFVRNLQNTKKNKQQKCQKLIGKIKPKKKTKKSKKLCGKPSERKLRQNNRNSRVIFSRRFYRFNLDKSDNSYVCVRLQAL